MVWYAGRPGRRGVTGSLPAETRATHLDERETNEPALAFDEALATQMETLYRTRDVLRRRRLVRGP